jgi:hypothetical protein
MPRVPLRCRRSSFAARGWIGHRFRMTGSSRQLEDLKREDQGREPASCRLDRGGMATAAGATGAASASADTVSCESLSSFDSRCAWIKGDGTETVTVDVARSDGVFGTARISCSNISPCEFKEATVYVTQCRGDLTGCGTIAVNSGGGSGVTEVGTSMKPGAGGHVYRACASWNSMDNWSYVNACTPWITGN